MAISNLLNLGQNSRQLICGFDNAYVAISSDNTRRYTYIGKAVRDLRTRYSAAGPNSGGMQQCFYNYFENNNNATSMDITIYATGNPCLIEGWCVDMAINKGFTLLNVIDPN